MNKNKIYKFNELRDCERVVSHLAVDVNEMLRTGIVPSGSSSEESNGIEEPNQIIGLVRDQFAAMDAQRIIKKYGKKAPKVAAEAVAEASAPVTDPKVSVSE